MSWQPEQDLSADLLAAFQSRFGISNTPSQPQEVSQNTKVLDCAEYVASQSIDVFIDRVGVQSAARSLLDSIRQKPFSTADWTAHQLHPNPSDGTMTEDEVVNFIFVMDLLNFSFWTDEREPWYVEYAGRQWTGYWSLVACLRRALDEGLPVTDLRWWASRERGMATMRYVLGGGSRVRRKPRWMRQKEEQRQREATEAAVDSSQAQDLTEGAVAAVEAETAEQTHQPDKTMQDSTDQPVELPTHDATPVERQADSGIVEPRPESTTGDDTTLVDEQSVADDDDIDDDETIDGSEVVEMPMLRERLDCLKEAARVLAAKYDGSSLTLVRAANKSAGRLVNILVRDFDCFNDVHNYEGYKIRLQKRAQIMVADLWACFQGQAGSPGEFEDIERLTAFADYRIPQMLNTLGVLSYSPPLDAKIRRKELLPSGSSWEVQLRGCSVWAVELLNKEIGRLSARDGDQVAVNAVLLDFHLYDSMKALEKQTDDAVREGTEEGKHLASNIVPHHRTRSIWY